MLTAKSARSKVITYCQVIVNMTRDSQKCCGKELSLTFPEVSLKTSAVETLQVKNAFNFIKTRFCNGCISLGVPGNFTTSLLKACVRYFLNSNVFLGYFERNTLKRNLPYSCFIFPLYHERFSPLSYHALPAFLKLLVLKI